MGVVLSEDPYATKQTLGGTGQPVGLRNISMRNNVPMPGEKPPIYVTSQGIASTDPQVGNYNRAAMQSAASPQIQAGVGGGAIPPPEAPPGVTAGAPPPTGPIPGKIARFASGLRGVGTNLLKAATPAILARTAAETAVTPTEETDPRVAALGMDTSAQVAQKVSNPIVASMRYDALPFGIGGLMAKAASVDPQLAGDLETRAKGAIMTGLGLNGIADRNIARGALASNPAAPSDPASQQTIRGSYTAPGVAPASGGYDPGVFDSPANDAKLQQHVNDRLAAKGLGGSPVDASRASLDTEISKLGKNPFQGIRGNNFYTGTGQQLASNVSDELNQRAKVAALQAKYGTDVTSANAMAANKLAVFQMQREQANKNQDELKSTFDRLATVQTMDKNGQPAGSTVDPGLRNRAEDFARNSVAGWDQLSPEERTQGFENVRHKFLLQEMMNSGQANALGNFMSQTGLSDQLGGYTAKPLKIKAVRTIGPGDLGQTSTSFLGGVVGRRPYVEFENGKLYPLRDIVNTPELQGAFENRLSQSSKEAQQQYLKYKGK